MKKHIISTLSVTLLLSAPHMLQAGKNKNKASNAHHSHAALNQATIAQESLLIDHLKDNERKFNTDIAAITKDIANLHEQCDTMQKDWQAVLYESKNEKNRDDFHKRADQFAKLKNLHVEKDYLLEITKVMLAARKDSLTKLIDRIQLLEPSERPDSFKSILKAIKDPKNIELQHVETVVSHKPIDELKLEKTVLYPKSIRDAAHKRDLHHVETVVSNEPVSVLHLETVLFASLLANIRNERKRKNLHPCIPVVSNKPLLTTDVPTRYYIEFAKTLRSMHHLFKYRVWINYEPQFASAEAKSRPALPTTSEYIAESELTLLKAAYTALKEEYLKLTEKNTSITENPVFNKNIDDFVKVETNDNNNNNNANPATIGSGWSLWPFYSPKK